MTGQRGGFRAIEGSGPLSSGVPPDDRAPDWHSVPPGQHRAVGGLSAAPSPLRTRLTDLLGVRYPIVQAGMGYVAGARLAAATSAAGGLGIIAATTMNPDQLRNAIEEIKSRTSAPFGVNFRADAPDAAEVIGLIIAGRVPVASFAQAPRPDQIARLREAGVLTIASAGARRHAEKAAAWGADAVIATGREGGGHVGSVPTSLTCPRAPN